MKYLFNNNLTKVEHEIAQYFYSHHKQIKDKTISDVAKACHVSPSKISKYANKIGYSGYKELKYQLLRENNQVVQNESVEFHKNQINQFFELFNIEQVEHLAQEIKKHSKIILWGDGPSRKVAEYFESRIRIASGNQVVTYSDRQTFSLDLEASPKALVIILSVSGENEKIAQIITTAKRAKADIVFISEAINAKYISDCYMYINLLPIVDEYKYEVIRSRSLFFIYLEILVQHLIKQTTKN